MNMPFRILDSMLEYDPSHRACEAERGLISVQHMI
jgi:hypothetical protein